MRIEINEEERILLVDALEVVWPNEREAQDLRESLLIRLGCLRASEAAPDLLEACEAQLQSHNPVPYGLCPVCRHYGDDCTAHALESAIRKARGEQ